MKQDTMQLTYKEIFKRNGVIAEYMGGIFYKDTPLILEIPIKSPVTGNNITCIDKLKYHSSMDWLYEVYQKLIKELETYAEDHANIYLDIFALQRAIGNGRPIISVWNGVFCAIERLNKIKHGQKL